MRNWIILLSFFNVFFLTGQEFKQAYVMDLNYLCRTSEEVRLADFPFYYSKSFAKEVQNEIKLQLKKRFKLENVYFLNADSIYYYAAGYTIATEARDYARYTRRDSTLYVSVETTVQGFGQIGDEFLYRFITKVNVYNNKGKRIYKYKNLIPFVSEESEVISGKAKMTDQDFYSFYLDGIQYAFEGKYKQVTKRYVSKPFAPEYQSFIDVFEKFYLEPDYNGIEFGSSFDDKIKVLNYEIEKKRDLSSELLFTQAVSIDNLEEGFKIENYLDSSMYRVRVKGGIDYFEGKYDPETDFTLEILDLTDTVIGELIFDKKYNLSGTYKNRKINIDVNYSNDCYEVYYDEQLIALINPFDYYSVYYLTPDITNDELSDLITISFTQLFARGIRLYFVLPDSI